MARYHINWHGDPGLCKAQPGKCPLAAEGKHFATKAEARTAYEATQATFPWSTPNVETTQTNCPAAPVVHCDQCGDKDESPDGGLSSCCGAPTTCEHQHTFAEDAAMMQAFGDHGPWLVQREAYVVCEDCGKDLTGERTA